LVASGLALVAVATAPASLASGASVEGNAAGVASARSSRFVTVTSVSCAAAGNCVADGSSSGTAYVLSEVHGAWGSARAVASNLYQGGPADGTAASCGSPGNCIGGGSGIGRGQTPSAFIVQDKHGVWRTAFVVADLGLSLTSASCGSAGNCVTGGADLIGQDTVGAFMVAEVNGHWAQPSDLGFNGGGFATVTSVSCSSAGNCAVGGYGDSAFLAIERDGHWGSGFRVGGNLSSAGAVLTSVSCAAEGSCGAGGYYVDSAGKFQGFVVNEASGHRGNAIEIPINRNGQAQLTVAVSCGSAGNCAAGGSFTGPDGAIQGFVLNEVSGRWGALRKVRGLGALNTGGRAYINAVSCASAGNCTAGGAFTTSTGTHPFVVSERNGVWGKASEIRGLSGNSIVNAVSCASAGNCAAVGPRFVVNETSGHWHRAMLVRVPA
jgi:hypothetical protein